MPLPAIAHQALNVGLGIAQAKWNDHRQIKQADKLGKMNLELQKQMADYNKAKELEMWEATSYPAQMRLMKQAGINPALMYGMGGGGGQTTGGGGAGVSPGATPMGGGELQQGVAMGMQSSLLAAQTKVLETQADLNKAEADKKRGIDTREGEQRIAESTNRIDEIKQTIDNKRWEYEILKLDKAMKDLQVFEMGETLDDRIDNVEYNTKIAMRNLQLLTNAAKVSDATVTDAIKEIRANAINAALQSAVIRNTADKTKWETEEVKTKIKALINDIQLRWQTLSNEQRRTQIQAALADFNTDPVNHATDQISGLIDNIFITTTPKGAPSTTNKTYINNYKK